MNDAVLERAVTDLARDSASLRLIVEEWFKNGPAAANNIGVELLVRKGLPRKEAQAVSACIITGVAAVMEYVKEKAGK